MLTADALVTWDVLRTYLGEGHDYLGDDDRVWAEGLINAASERANMISGRKLASRAATVKLDGTGGDVLLLPEYPVTAIAEVKLDTARAFGTDTVLDADDYVLYEDGRLYFPSGLPSARQCVQITYTAGYVTVPPDLQLAVVECVAYGWKRFRSRAIGTSSITADGVTTQYEIDIPMPARRVFESYRRVWA